MNFKPLTVNLVYYFLRQMTMLGIFAKALSSRATTIAVDLIINSSARLKANIFSLGSTLAKLLQIDGKTHTMKKDKSKKQKIGVLAQDIEKVFPELVSESNGIKSVNY